MTGPFEVFTGADTGGPITATARPTTSTARASSVAPVRTSSGLRVTPVEDLREFHVPDPDLLIVLGEAGPRWSDPERSGWPQAHGHEANRLVRRALAPSCWPRRPARRTAVTTHWGRTPCSRWPEVPGRSAWPRNRSSSGTATSPPRRASPLGIDPALALAEDDLGRDAALDVARQLVVFLRRPGN